MSFPFPYFGHAFSEAVILDVCVWFQKPASAKDRELISRELTAVHAFWGEAPTLDVMWSEGVVTYDMVLERERKVPLTDARIAAAFKGADLARYGKPKKTTPFGLHLAVDRVIEALHAKFPVAFAARESGSKDKLSPWHEWSLSQRAPVLERISKYVSSNPPAFTTRRGEFQWVAPWLHASTRVARALTTKSALTALDGGAKAALSDFFTTVAEHAEPRADWPRDMNASDIDECRGALRALASKLGGPSKVLSSAADVLAQIEKEAEQFEFTRIKLTDCPTFESVKTNDALRFQVAVLALEKHLRFLEKLSGNRPGNTSIAFGADDQQLLQLREKLISQLLRRKGTFGEPDAVAMLETMSSTIRPLGWWMPTELIAEKLKEHVKQHGRSEKFSDALKKLLKAKYPLENDDLRKLFAKL